MRPISLARRDQTVPQGLVESVEWRVTSCRPTHLNFPHDPVVPSRFLENRQLTPVEPISQDLRQAIFLE